MSAFDILDSMQSMQRRILVSAGGVLLALLTLVPAGASAQASNFEITGWIPYWRTATGTADTLPHLDKLTEVNAFVYTLKQDGTLSDNGNLDQEPWLSFHAAAKAKGVRVIPTVMSGDRTLMRRILTDVTSRKALVDEIVRTVNQKNFDGIDIDFEGKSADTRDPFSAFLRELQAGLGGKWLMCTIETRIPLADQYFGVTTLPVGAGEYSNDLKAINEACDRVRIMAYDQQRIDRSVNVQWDARGELYGPVADPAWVEKVVNHMSKDIPKSKMLIGIPTYGYEYAVTTYANNEYVYDILWTFNPGYAWPLAAERGITPVRAPWGEMQFTYIANTPTSTPSNLGATSGLLASVAASMFATQNNSNTTFRYVVWPDAVAVQQKVDLAKRLGVRGVSVFKFDGGQDPGIWNTFAGVRGTIEQKPAPSNASVIANLQAQILVLQAQLAAMTGTTPPTSGTSAASGRAPLTRAFVIGSRGEDVRTLQIILNSSSDTRVAASGVGSPGQETSLYGALTRAAVQKFQIKHGIAKQGGVGYGIVGPATRAKLNAILSGL